MKISELIKKLEETKNKKGDLNILITMPNAPVPDWEFGNLTNRHITLENDNGETKLLIDAGY